MTAPFLGLRIPQGYRYRPRRCAVRGARWRSVIPGLALVLLVRHHAGRSRINVGTLSVGSGWNVIADHAFMQLEGRGENDEIAEYMLRRARAIITAAAAQEVEVLVKTVGRTTTADSDPALAQTITDVGRRIPGVSVTAKPHLAGGSEDATYFMRRVQKRGGEAVYAVIGSDLASGHHTPQFDIDETDIGWGIELIASTLLRVGGTS